MKEPLNIPKYILSVLETTFITLESFHSVPGTRPTGS